MGNLSKFTPTFSGRKAVVEKEEESRGLGCAAHGCPRIGTISASSGPKADFFCWLHDMAKQPMDIPRITAAINDNIGLINMIDMVGRIPLVELEGTSRVSGKQAEIDAYFRSVDYPESVRRWDDEKKAWEPKVLWAMRLRSLGWWVINGKKPEDRRRALA
jgi:hypothetical protein